MGNYKPTRVILCCLLASYLVVPLPLWGGQWSHHQLQVDGLSRDYLLYLPTAKEDHCSARPLVLLLHGTGMDASWMIRTTGMQQIADHWGFVLAVPNAMKTGGLRSWNAGGRHGWMARRAVDDVQFIWQLIADVKRQTPIDLGRIHATGFSGGGMMCYHLASQVDSPFASIAPVSGTASNPPPTDAPPIAILHIHGRLDRIVPWDGPNWLTPRNLDFLSVPQTIATWRMHNQCKPEARGYLAEGCSESWHTRKLAETEVLLVDLGSGRHRWPENLPLAGPALSTDRCTDTGHQIARFFFEHPKSGDSGMRATP
jgi:polyhydroxybutyrate depolymerase